MADASAPPFLDPSWLDAQRRYWEAWSEMADKEAGANWSRALDDWWAAVRERLGDDADDANGHACRHFVEQSGRFFRMAELLGRLRTGPDGEADAEVHRELIERLRHWQRDAVALARPFAPWAQGLPGLDALHEWERTPLRAALSGYQKAVAAWLPSLGPGRELHGRVQRLLRHFRTVDAALAEFDSLQSAFAEDIISRLSSELAVRGAAGPPVQSLRELYGLWIDSAEAAYRELVMRDDYSRAFGEVVNALVRAGGEARALINDALADCGVATREDTDRLLDEVRALRRELDETKASLGSLSEAVAAAKRDPG